LTPEKITWPKLLIDLQEIVSSKHWNWWNNHALFARHSIGGASQEILSAK
jgi:hypothetical protein